MLKDAKPQITIIGHDVWIGSNVVIIAGVRVGHGAAIGAGAVSTKDVPPYAIMIGNPARILRFRFPHEICAALIESAWWDLPTDTIAKLPLKDPVACINAIRELRSIDKI